MRTLLSISAFNETRKAVSAVREKDLINYLNSNNIQAVTAALGNVYTSNKIIKKSVEVSGYKTVEQYVQHILDSLILLAEEYFELSNEMEEEKTELGNRLGESLYDMLKALQALLNKTLVSESQNEQIYEILQTLESIDEVLFKPWNVTRGKTEVKKLLILSETASEVLKLTVWEQNVNVLVERFSSNAILPGVFTSTKKKVSCWSKVPFKIKSRLIHSKEASLYSGLQDWIDANPEQWRAETENYLTKKGYDVHKGKLPMVWLLALVEETQNIGN